GHTDGHHLHALQYFRDHGSDHRRLSDRHLLLALAVPRQHRARPLGRRRRVAGDRLDKPDFSLLRGFDVTGLVLMAIFLGCLEYALEEGPRWDWLDEKTIRAAVIVSAVAGGLFFWRVVSYRQPIVDLRAFLYRNFALGAFYTFVMGIGMYVTTYLVPLFLAQVRGFSALQIGETVFVVGVALLVLSLFNFCIARAMGLLPLLAIGLGVFGFSVFLAA